MLGLVADEASGHLVDTAIQLRIPLVYMHFEPIFRLEMLKMQRNSVGPLLCLISKYDVVQLRPQTIA